MQKKYWFWVFNLVCLAFLSTSVWANSLSPLGYWKIINNRTGKAQSIIKLWQDKGVLYGKIIKPIKQPGVVEPKVCSQCSGSYHNKPIVGMTILWGFHQQGQEWVGGNILDPTSGEIYSCKLHVINDGKTLKVRGYVGISLFGRTEYWQRVSKPTS